MQLLSTEFVLGSILGGVLGNFAFWLAVRLVITTKSTSLPAIRSFFRLHIVLSSIRMVAFNRNREDYSRFHPTKKSIATFVSTAQQELIMVGVNLMSGIAFDGLRTTLEQLLERESPVHVTISLLNPNRKELMSAICATFEQTPEELAASIKFILNQLLEFKSRLSARARVHFHIKLHATVPFASAILIDSKLMSSGRLQVEAKPYQATFKNSIGFEILNSPAHPMYAVLDGAYRKLIADGEEVFGPELQSGASKNE